MLRLQISWAKILNKSLLSNFETIFENFEDENKYKEYVS
jgi:hypothetical protein